MGGLQPPPNEDHIWFRRKGILKMYFLCLKNEVEDVLNLAVLRIWCLMYSFGQHRKFTYAVIASYVNSWKNGDHVKMCVFVWQRGWGRRIGGMIFFSPPCLGPLETPMCDRIWKVSYGTDEKVEITIHLYNNPKNKNGSKLLLQAGNQSLLC